MMKFRLLFLIFFLPFYIVGCGGGSVIEIDPDEDENEEVIDPNDNLPLLKTLKIMTYNIHSCNPPSKPGVADVDAIVKVIESANADVVFLQEVDKNTGRNKNYDDQAEVIAKKLGMNAQFFPARAQGIGHYGVAILTKYTIEDIKLHLLPKPENLEQRVMGTAVIKLTGKERIVAAVTHLQHNSQENRLDQIKEVVNILKSEKRPVVLGADFNELITTTDFFNVFDKDFTRTCLDYNCPYTFPAINPRSMIDYLAFKPSTAFQVNSHSTINETYASDHLPVVSVLTFKR